MDRIRIGFGYACMPLLCCALLAARAPAARAETFDCLINPSVVLKIGSPVTSTLQSVSVDRGMHVVRGQEIARLESSVEAASVALRKARAESLAEIMSRRAKVESAQLEVDRSGRQVEGFSISAQKVAELRTTLRVAQQDLALAVLDHDLAQLELAQAQAQLEQRIIRSPIDGVVTERLLGPGEYVHQDTHIVTLAAIDPLYVEVYPPVGVHGQIALGDVAQVMPEAPIGGHYAAKVTIIDQVFDAGSGTFGVRLLLPNPQGELPGGTRCRVSFDHVVARAADPAGPTRR
jgi:RND family efflux transporter MFP subunit